MLHSVRARLTLWYTAILALVLVTFSAISYALMARAIRSATDESLSGTAHEFAAAFAAEPANAAAAHDVRLDFRYSDRDILVFAPNGEVVVSSYARMTTGDRQRLVDGVRRGRAGFVTIPGGRDDAGIRAVSVPISVVGKPYRVVVAQHLEPQANRLEQAAHAVILGIPLALLVAAAGGYLMARKSLAPVTAMSQKARHIGAETLDERIEVENERDELGFLAMTLNDLLERLQRAFESQRRFMADASHELRTPIAIIQGEADVTLSRADRSPGEYRESIGIMRESALKLTRVVQNIFLLARSDAGSVPITRSRFYLDELLADCVRSMRTVAAARAIDLTCHTPADLIIVADEELIHRLLLNLIDNALKFTPSGGRVDVHAERDGDSYLVRVSDSGAGIPPDDQGHVFERFFRRRSGGAGLGLPIARWIAEAHGGELRLERSDQSGSTFAVRLPVAVSS